MAVAIQHIVLNMQALNATPAFRAVGTASSGTGAVTPGLPTGHTTNDILLCYVQSSNQAISAPTNSGSGTWTEVTNSPQNCTFAAAGANANRLGVFWMRDPGTTIGTVTVADTGDHTIAQIAAFSGCLTSGNPWNITSGSNSGSSTETSAIVSDLTTTVGNCLIVMIHAHALDTNTPTAAFTANAGLLDANPTQQNGANGVGTNSGTGGGLVLGTGTRTGAGAIVSASHPDVSKTISSSCNLTIALTSN